MSSAMDYMSRPTRADKVAIALDAIAGDSDDINMSADLLQDCLAALQDLDPATWDDFFFGQGEYVFAKRAYARTSEELDTILFNMENNRILCQANPWYSAYGWLPDRRGDRVRLAEQRLGDETSKRIRSSVESVRQTQSCATG